MSCDRHNAERIAQTAMHSQYASDNERLNAETRGLMLENSAIKSQISNLQEEGRHLIGLKCGENEELKNRMLKQQEWIYQIYSQLGSTNTTNAGPIVEEVDDESDNHMTDAQTHPPQIQQPTTHPPSDSMVCFQTQSVTAYGGEQTQTQMTPYVQSGSHPPS